LKPETCQEFAALIDPSACTIAQPPALRLGDVLSPILVVVFVAVAKSVGAVSKPSPNFNTSTTTNTINNINTHLRQPLTYLGAWRAVVREAVWEEAELEAEREAVQERLQR